MKRADTKAILRQLGRTYLKAIDLEFELRLAKDDAVDAARERATALYREMAELRVLSWREWRGRARPLLDDISRTNAQLQRAIRSIERDLHRAQSVVKALGHIDDAIAKAASIRG